MSFDGTDDVLDVGSGIIGSTLDNWMSLLVFKPETSSGDFAVVLSDGGVGDHRAYVPYLDAGNMYFGYLDSATAMDDGAVSLAQQLVTCQVDSTTASGFKDGVAFSGTATYTAAGTATANTYSPVIGGYEGPGGAYLEGNFQEIIVYPSDQSANRIGIETNINDHYGIY